LTVHIIETSNSWIKWNILGTEKYFCPLRFRYRQVSL